MPRNNILQLDLKVIGGLHLQNRLLLLSGFNSLQIKTSVQSLPTSLPPTPYPMGKSTSATSDN